MLKGFKLEIRLFLIVALLAVVLVVGGILLFAFLNKSGINPITSAQCNQLAQEVDTLIKQANYCEVDEDCVVSDEVVYGCSCPNLVNKDADLTNIQTRIAEWEASCDYRSRICSPCSRPPQILACKANKCTATSYISVTVATLKESSVLYHNKRVLVEGVYRWGFEDSNFDETADSEEYNIWVEITDKTELENIPGNYLDYVSGPERTRNPSARVTIYGTFHAYDPTGNFNEPPSRGNFGHLGLWKHEIVADKIVFQKQASSGKEFSAKIIGSYTSPGESSKVAVYGNVAYLTDISHGLLAIDVSNPANPKLMDSLQVAGGGAYAVSESGATFLSHVLVGGYGNASLVAVGTDSPKGLEILSEGTAQRSVQEIVPLVDFTYFLAIDGPEFEIYDAFEGKSKGVINGTPGGHILDFDVVFKGPPSYKQFLLAAQGEKGLAIFTINTLTKSLEGEAVQSWTGANLAFVLNFEGYTFAVATELGSQDFAYVLSGGDIVIVDITDAENPKKHGSLPLLSGSADLDAVNGIVAVAIWNEGVQFVDVSNPDNPVSLGVVDTPGRARDVELIYNSQGDAYYAYVADDRDDLQIIEVRR